MMEMDDGMGWDGMGWDVMDCTRGERWRWVAVGGWQYVGLGLLSAPDLGEKCLGVARAVQLVCGVDLSIRMEHVGDSDPSRTTLPRTATLHQGVPHRFAAGRARELDSRISGSVQNPRF
jgi:hypothetical protein